MNDRNVVVIGGAGFIGSNLAEALAKKNQVIVVDDLSTGHLENIQDLIKNHSITFIEGSVTNIDLLQKTFKNVDYVFHQAAMASVSLSIKNPVLTHDANVNGTLNVLIAARDNNVEKVVFASSCAVYGNQSDLPIKENIPPNPSSPYATSKIMCENYCQIFTESYNLSTTSLRYFNVYGPRQNPAGEYAAVIPKFIIRVLDGKPPEIFGDGKQTRDFIFINDIIEANILAAKSSSDGVFNIGNGTPISINEVAKLVMKITGTDLDIIYSDARQDDIRHSFADISKAKEILQYKPIFSLTDGLDRTIKQFQNRLENTES